MQANGMVCENFPVPTNADEADCMFEAVGLHCSSEHKATKLSGNDLLEPGSWSSNPVLDGSCWWDNESPGELSQCNADGSGARRLCGCKGVPVSVPDAAPGVAPWHTQTYTHVHAHVYDRHTHTCIHMCMYMHV